MRTKHPHLPDQDLLLALDGELPPRRLNEAHEHLSICEACRARLETIGATLADFNHAYHLSLDPQQLPPAAHPRALLQAQLAEIAGDSRRLPKPQMVAAAFMRYRWAYICAGVFLVVFAVRIMQQQLSSRESESIFATLDASAIPNRMLTPGVALPVTMADVCESTHHNEKLRAIPMPLRRQVLQEYGLAANSANNYEIDYLITPGLGGAPDVRNLWPEPYSSTAWNAHVKDALEDRLHQLVCERKLDLTTAQHDIATDWITAYKKYFHTNKPLRSRGFSSG